MKLRYLHSSLKRTLTLFLGLLIFVSFTASAYAVEYVQAPDTLDALLDKINAEFGTNFHVITPEESRERYGFEIPYSNPAPMTKARLLELEEYFRHFAMVEIPKINKRTQEALAISASIEKAKQDYLASVNRIKKQWEDNKVYCDEQEKLIQAEEADAVNRRDNCKAWLENYEANKPADVSQKINDIQHHNEMHRKVEAYLQAKQEQDAAQARVVSHIEKLNALSQERAQLIQDAKLPIAGLTFTEDGLELNGIPFVTGKVSDSQIMEVAARLIIAKNPTVKVFRIARGESLGKKKMEALVTFARENGFQGFVEQVVREQNELKVEEYSEK